MGDPPSRVVERPGRITITHEQAERVVEKYYESEDDISITTLEEFKCGGFSSLTATKNFLIHLSDLSILILRVSPPSPDIFQLYAPNSLEAEHQLLQLINSKSEIPSPEILGFDTSGVDIPYSYILLLLYSPSRLKIDSNAKLESEDEHEHEHETKIEDKAKPISLPELEPESKPKSKPESGSDLELKPHPKLLTLRTLQTSHPLTPRQTLLLDLHLGSYFSQLHTNIQNDWFGLPKHEKEEGRYSWQETFVGLLEDVLGELEGRTSDMTEGGGGGEEVVIPFGDIRKYLSRAIGFFLFDDCEVPSLVSFLGDEDSILVLVDSDSLSNSKGITQQEDENTKVEKVGDVIEEGKEGKEEEEEEVKILSALPVSHALWGDPLLETIFLNNPSKAFLEGYGKPKLFVFPRQKTKRMWYTLFLGLVVLVQARRDQENYHSSDDDDDDEGGEWRKEKKKWAKEMVAKCVEELKDAPCY